MSTVKKAAPKKSDDQHKKAAHKRAAPEHHAPVVHHAAPHKKRHALEDIIDALAGSVQQRHTVDGNKSYGHIVKDKLMDLVANDPTLTNLEGPEIEQFIKDKLGINKK